MATLRVRAANKATPNELAPHLPRAVVSPAGPATLSLHAALTLSARTRDALYTLFDSNMGALAAGTSMAHTRVNKMEEMFHHDARYLLVTRDPMPGAMPRTRRAVDFGEDEILAFASFRFDTEETMGEDDAEVAYCYELQVSPAARGAGLGHTLMTELEGIGRARGMAKAMLTCLADNSGGLAFYQRAGYTPDEIDPTRVAEEDDWEDLDEHGERRRHDYRILSKAL